MRPTVLGLAFVALAVTDVRGVTPQEPAEVLTNADILALTEAGLPPSVILAKMAATGTAFDPSVEQLVVLSQAGVDPVVITAMIPPAAALTSQSIDFGDDTSQWAFDGECDDPRFQGSGTALASSDRDRGRDATDCRELLESGRVTLTDLRDASLRDVAAEPPDFGDDTSQWALDGECDDSRFRGSGMASFLSDENRGHDATDCRQLFESGLITLRDPGPVRTGPRE